MKRRLIVLFLFVSAFLYAYAGTLCAADLKDVYDDAQRNFKRGKYELAVQLWTRILTPEPTDTGGEMIDPATVYFNRGMTYKKLLMWEAAADDFSMVVGLNPNDAEAFYQRGGCYANLGLADKANADVLRACTLDDKYCTEKMLEQKRGKNKENWGH
jgi:tetratricopeptide (TPR) repeat protein